MTGTTLATTDRRSFLVGTLVPGLTLLVLAFSLGAFIFARGNNPFRIDEGWNLFLASWESEPVLWLARGMNVAGGTWFGIYVVPAVCAIALILLRRPWAATYFIAASIADALLVQVLKRLFGRARPEDIIVVTDFGSFPSGHVANAATIATVFIVLFTRWFVVVVGVAWVLLMAFSRTYLHAHWLSDTLGGAMIGAAAALLVAAAFTAPLLRDRARLRLDVKTTPAVTDTPA